MFWGQTLSCPCTPISRPYGIGDDFNVLVAGITFGVGENTLTNFNENWLVVCLFWSNKLITHTHAHFTTTGKNPTCFPTEFTRAHQNALVCLISSLFDKISGCSEAKWLLLSRPSTPISRPWGKNFIAHDTSRSQMDKREKFYRYP